MVHNIIHYLVILTVTFNVHLNVYLSNHAQPILYGMHVSMFVIGQQLLLVHLIITITEQHRTVMVEAITAHHHHHPMEVHHHRHPMEVHHHLIHTEEKNVQQLNA